MNSETTFAIVSYDDDNDKFIKHFGHYHVSLLEHTSQTVSLEVLTEQVGHKLWLTRPAVDR